MEKLIIALGGNALIQKGQKGTAEEQFANIRKPVRAFAELSKEYHLVITHGNGPQSGNIMLQQESTVEVPKMPLAVIGAMTQGQIGFMIESTLDEELMKLGLDEKRLFLTILTYTGVKIDDPAFQNPTKPVGPAYPNPQPGFVKTSKGWRRVVPSPKPYKIFQWREIKRLMEENFIIVACGGGGIPVIEEKVNGVRKIRGVEAVIDKDFATAKLAEQIGADIMIIATDEEKVALNFGKPDEIRFSELSLTDAKKYLEEGQFPKGSMGPKVQACINFIESGGKQAIITSIDYIHDALAGKAGTHFHL
ncbi:MAG: carbamate kinase [Promethearchaeota archaeon]